MQLACRTAGATVGAGSDSRIGAFRNQYSEKLLLARKLNRYRSSSRHTQTEVCGVALGATQLSDREVEVAVDQKGKL